MAKIAQKLVVIEKALASLKRSVFLYEKVKTSILPGNEENLLMARDSMIQRFEYCTDLLWKVLKLYMEEIEKVNLEIVSPRGVIREVVKSKLLSEVEGVLCMKMVVSRNQTSHIYHEGTAAAIAQDVPDYSQLMNTIIVRVAQKVV